jgi:hypothetical protein
MRLDIYRRAEHDGKFSYLVVPETKNIPEEATNTDWEIEARAVEVDDNAGELPDYDIRDRPAGRKRLRRHLAPALNAP